MKTPRHKIFDTFVTRLGLYNGLIFQAKNLLRDAKKSRLDFSKKIKTGRSKQFYMGTKLVFRNWLTGEYEFLYTYEVNSKNIEKTVAVFNTQFSNFCFAQCFEAFETFLKDVLSLKLVKDRKNSFKLLKDLDTSSIVKCRKSLEPLFKKNNKNRYNKIVFKYIRDLSVKPSKELSFILNQFDEWYIVFSEVRHCIVHSNSELSNLKTNNWTTYQKRILHEFFSKKKKGDAYLIDAFPDYSELIKTVARHGQMIYDCLQIPK